MKVGKAMKLNGDWRRSSRSGDQGNCVEARRSGADAVEVRDSKDPDGPTLTVSATAWTAFLETVR